MNIKKSGFWLAFNLLALLSVVLTACSGQSASAAEPSPVPTVKPTSLTGQTSAALKPTVQVSPSVVPGKLKVFSWWASGNDLTGSQ